MEAAVDPELALGHRSRAAVKWDLHREPMRCECVSRWEANRQQHERGPIWEMERNKAKCQDGARRDLILSPASFPIRIEETPARRRQRGDARKLNRASTRSSGRRFPLTRRRRRPLTVDEDDLDHGEGEEGQRGHLHLHQQRSQQEDHQDDRQAARDAQLLRDPAPQPQPPPKKN